MAAQLKVDNVEKIVVVARKEETGRYKYAAYVVVNDNCMLYRNRSDWTTSPDWVHDAALALNRVVEQGIKPNNVEFQFA